VIGDIYILFLHAVFFIYGEFYYKFAAFHFFGFYFYCTVKFFDNSVTYWQPDAGTFSNFLCSKERLKDFIDNGFGNTNSVVSNFNNDMFIIRKGFYSYFFIRGTICPSASFSDTRRCWTFSRSFKASFAFIIRFKKPVPVCYDRQEHMEGFLRCPYQHWFVVFSAVRQ